LAAITGCLSDNIVVVVVHSSFIHFFIATNVKTHSPLHMTKTYYDYVTR